MSKFTLLLGLAAGYVIGTAQGRGQFEKMKNSAQDLWQRPQVQDTVKKVDDFVAQKAPGLHDMVSKSDASSTNGDAASDTTTSFEPAGSTSSTSGSASDTTDGTTPPAGSTS